MAAVTRITLVCALGLAAAASAAEPTAGDVSLHCTGKTWRMLSSSDEIPTDAILRIDNAGTYISISGVGSGQSDKRPRAASNVESVGSIQLQSAVSGQPPLDAWFNVNRYTGELLVAPTGSGGKAFFLGSCKNAQPLF